MIKKNVIQISIKREEMSKIMLKIPEADPAEPSTQLVLSSLAVHPDGQSE
jgi:hypothetical protein